MDITHGDESQVGYFIGLMVCNMHRVTGRCALIFLQTTGFFIGEATTIYQ
jgi:hypothetical protein